MSTHSTTKQNSLKLWRVDSRSLIKNHLIKRQTSQHAYKLYNRHLGLIYSVRRVILITNFKIKQLRVLKSAQALNIFSCDSKVGVMIQDDVISFWQPETAQRVKTLVLNNYHKISYYSVTQEMACFYCGELTIIKSTGKRHITSITNEIENNISKIKFMTYSPDGKYILIQLPSMITIITNDLNQLWYMEEKSQYSDFKFSTNSDIFLAASRENIMIYQTRTGQLLKTIKKSQFKLFEKFDSFNKDGPEIILSFQSRIR